MSAIELSTRRFERKGAPKRLARRLAVASRRAKGLPTPGERLEAAVEIAARMRRGRR